MTSLEQLNEMHLDVLREIGNIGSGNAATALSQFLGVKVDMTTPTVRLLGIYDAADALGGLERATLAMLVRLTGDIDAIMMFIMDEAFISSILNILLGDGTLDPMNMSEMQRSVISEIGNIMIAAYAKSIAEISGLFINISVPAITYDYIGSMLSVPAVEMGAASDKILFIEDDYFGETEMASSANMMLVPSIPSLNKLLESLGIEL
ncbi:MAG: chemotaxis protein CheC [Clostridiales bacterium]|nr:chemotaxis protein CheC [Clostridiales bacterium]